MIVGIAHFNSLPIDTKINIQSLYTYVDRIDSTEEAEMVFKMSMCKKSEMTVENIKEKIILCGGGRKNKFLIEKINKLLHPSTIALIGISTKKINTSLTTQNLSKLNLLNQRRRDLQSRRKTIAKSFISHILFA